MNEPEYQVPQQVSKLLDDYPRLFAKGARLDVWFPPGWAGILRTLCAGIDRLLDDRLAAEFQVLQVKEKFGTLRFYYQFAHDAKLTIDIQGTDGTQRIHMEPSYPPLFPAAAVDALVGEAERLSAVTCSRCGSPGLLRKGGWLRVTCARCERASPQER
ncbi:MULTISPECIES: hypothetical protein [Ramlibacter]|uniref:Uncharacterized protein n=1 Tax=Ramlibacter pinisoli TaxID=2682844 RepID=A0A6N8IYH6_9BURK|nr:MULTISPECIES: hypothetical protein [Ramlibacter]MBA2962128.1 hypothetical protein [Ramlibacter sp. CGMCC 1.13660]MVQ32071.1 hypothetical protein [Ramlibacter pinisoli]